MNSATIRSHGAKITRTIRAARVLDNNTGSRQQSQQLALQKQSRLYYTNTDSLKRDDPYAQLGLEWGTAPTTAEIKSAFRRKAAQLHPDVNQHDSPAVAQRKFQELLNAYNTLINVHSNLAGISAEKDDEWREAVYRNGDRIAVNRNDVAGAMRRRPAPSASRDSPSTHSKFTLGHPQGGTMGPRNEYLGSFATPKSSSVGRGINKWVTPKEYVPWKKVVEEEKK